ncbi:hypothetical protein SeLEV6574_g00768 [Synchytrium endobioticum]|uniref:Endonuclease/exonuclease/phosphatase domain-containing protein n=1 Tax=Synchytrium endobioticum TaxID=286115 RepID=A0A507DH02_9FUNG|nr:hypothetical protein SeLEV6574_g00768 [Synchytrium endobioticum]
MLRIASYNTRYGNADDGENSWEFRRQLFYRSVVVLNPDILSLQELVEFQKHELLEGLKGQGLNYEYVGRARGHQPWDGEYSAIMFKPDIFRLLDSSTFWYSDTPDTPGNPTWDSALPRVCTWAVLKRLGSDTAPPIVIYNSHFDLSVISRSKSFPLLLSRIATNGHDQEPCLLITGDFNVESHAEFSPLTNAGFVDTYDMKNTNATPAERSTFHNFTGRQNPRQPKIDAIFIRPDKGLTVTDAGIDRYHEVGRYPSDHFAVYASLDV